MAAADPGGRLSLSLTGMAGARGLLSRPEFADTYRRLGLVAWVRGGQVTAVTPVTGRSDEVWAAHTRALLAEGSSRRTRRCTGPPGLTRLVAGRSTRFAAGRPGGR